MSRQPPSVTRAILALWGLVALSGLTALLTAVFREDVMGSLRSGTSSSGESAIAPPAFVPVAVVLFLVFAALVWIFVVFLLGGHNWARISIVATVVFLAVSAVAGLRTGLPAVFVVVAVASFVLDAVVLFFLLHRDTSAYLRPPASSEHTPPEHTRA